MKFDSRTKCSVLVYHTQYYTFFYLLTNPTCAILRSSIVYSKSSPKAPNSQTSGACSTSVVKKWFPLPPAPPRAAINIVPSVARSPTTFPLPFLTIVPIGTLITLWSAFLPKQSLPCPASPSSALRTVGRWSKSLMSDEAWSMTCPPLPPSPPSGPARSLAHRCRKDIAPSPPLPPMARTCRRSTKLCGYLSVYGSVDCFWWLFVTLFLLDRCFLLRSGWGTVCERLTRFVRDLKGKFSLFSIVMRVKIVLKHFQLTFDCEVKYIWQLSNRRQGFVISVSFV